MTDKPGNLDVLPADPYVPALRRSAMLINAMAVTSFLVAVVSVAFLEHSKGMEVDRTWRPILLFALLAGFVFEIWSITLAGRAWMRSQVVERGKAGFVLLAVFFSPALPLLVLMFLAG